MSLKPMIKKVKDWNLKHKDSKEQAKVQASSFQLVRENMIPRLR